MVSLKEKGEPHHVSLWTGADKQWFSGPRYNTSVLKHTIYVSEVMIYERREKCFGEVCNEHGMYIAPYFEDNWSKYEKKSPWPTGQIFTGKHSCMPSKQRQSHVKMCYSEVLKLPSLCSTSWRLAKLFRSGCRCPGKQSDSSVLGNTSSFWKYSLCWKLVYS